MTLEALLNRAALAIEDTVRLENNSGATVSFSIAPLSFDRDLEEVLCVDGDEFTITTHRRAKTVMLAD